MYIFHSDFTYNSCTFCSFVIIKLGEQDGGTTVTAGCGWVSMTTMVVRYINAVFVIKLGKKTGGITDGARPVLSCHDNNGGNYQECRILLFHQTSKVFIKLKDSSS